MNDIERTGRTVVGLFRDRAHAEAAIRDLQASGFPDDRIGVAMQDDQQQRQLELDTGSQAAEGAAAGAVSGGVTGEALAVLQRHEVDFVPGGADRYDPVDWTARDNTTAAATPGDAEAALADLGALPAFGSERRKLRDPSYAGPERRLIGV